MSGPKMAIPSGLRGMFATPSSVRQGFKAGKRAGGSAGGSKPPRAQSALVAQLAGDFYTTGEQDAGNVMDVGEVKGWTGLTWEQIAAAPLSDLQARIKRGLLKSGGDETGRDMLDNLTADEMREIGGKGQAQLIDEWATGWSQYASRSLQQSAERRLRNEDDY